MTSAFGSKRHEKLVSQRICKHWSCHLRCYSKPDSKLYYDWRSVGQSVFVSSPRLGPKTRFLLLSNSFEIVDVGRPLWREDGSVVYNCCWPSPAQSFSSPSPAELMSPYYFLRFEIIPTWMARSLYLCPPGTGWPSYTPRHWVTFHRLLRLAGLRWRYSTPPLHGIYSINFI
jgi:hypothetical protein